MTSRAGPPKRTSLPPDPVEHVRIPVGTQVIALPNAVADHLRCLQEGSPVLDVTQVWITESGGKLRMYFGDVEQGIAD